MHVWRNYGTAPSKGSITIGIDEWGGEVCNKCTM